MRDMKHFFALLPVFLLITACTSPPSQPDKHVSAPPREPLGPDDVFAFSINSPDRNMPPLNWREGFSDPDEVDNPYIFDWTYARMRQGWIAVGPLEEAQYADALQQIRAAEERMLQQGGNGPTGNTWTLRVIDNTPPINWRKVVPYWIDDPAHIDWAAYRLEHGWLLNEN